MEVQLIIDGSFDEIQEVFRLLSAGIQPEAILESLEPIHHPHEARVPAREVMLTPMGPMPIVQETAQPIPLDLQREETRSNGAVLNPEIPNPATEPVPIDGRVDYKHCMTCGTQYVAVPKQEKPFCSKSCYMKDWLDRHKSKKEVAPDTTKTANDAMKTAPDENNVAVKEAETRYENLEIRDEKLKKNKGKKFLPERKYILKDNFGDMF